MMNCNDQTPTYTGQTCHTASGIKAVIYPNSDHLDRAMNEAWRTSLHFRMTGRSGDHKADQIIEDGIRAVTGWTKHEINPDPTALNDARCNQGTCDHPIGPDGLCSAWIFPPDPTVGQKETSE